MRPSSAQRRRLPMRTLRTALSPEKSAVDKVAKTEPIATPTGVAIRNPVLLLPSNTPGVASACSARKPAEDKKARET